MGRYDKYRETMRKETVFRDEQIRLHERHEDIDEDTVIIETPNTLKFILSFLQVFMKTLFGIFFILLATVGILTLLHPDSRDSFLMVMEGIFRNIHELI